MHMLNKTDPSMYDLKQAVSSNRLVGMWRMTTGYRLAYLAANGSQAVSALLKTTTFLLLRYFVDNVMGQSLRDGILPLIALGFVTFASLLRLASLRRLSKNR